jgi:hypothetical protein
MNLGYFYPLSARLEVQSTSSSAMRFGHFADFYATSSDLVTVTGVPQGATVELLGSSGQVYSSSVAGAGGTVTLDIAAPDMPLAAYVQVVELDRTLASTTTTVEVWAGNDYSVSYPAVGP